jgi:hypothetical protein
MRPRFPGKLRHPFRIEIDQSAGPNTSGETSPNWQVAVSVIFGALEPLSVRDQLAGTKEMYGVSAKLTIRDPRIALPPGRVRFVSLQDGRTWYPGTVPPPDADGYIVMTVSETQI